MEGGKSLIATILRIFATVSFLGAFVVFIYAFRTSHDAVELNQFFTDLVAAFVINLIGCAYNLFASFLRGGTQLWRTVAAVDMIVNLLVAAGMGAGWVTYTHIIGECTTCDQFPNFCSLVLGAQIISTVGVFFSVWLMLYILHVILDPLLYG